MAGLSWWGWGLAGVLLGLLAALVVGQRRRLRRAHAPRILASVLPADDGASARGPAEVKPVVVAEAPPLIEIGPYRVVRLLGQGSMGKVYLARQADDGRLLAVKTLFLAELAGGEAVDTLRQRFLREAEAARRLSHPAIVAVDAVGEANGLLYMAMTYVTGECLSAHASPETLWPLERVLAVLARVADALDYAHTRQIVHRDIKPANLFYDPATDEVRILDFGLARLGDSALTQAGTLLGTPSYMAPEQLLGRPVDGRADLFALGVTLYQLCCGRRPFDGDSLIRVMQQIVQAPVPDIRVVRPDLPPAVCAVIERALQKAPADRFQSGAALADALRQCLAALPAIRPDPVAAR